MFKKLKYKGLKLTDSNVFSICNEYNKRIWIEVKILSTVTNVVFSFFVADKIKKFAHIVMQKNLKS